MLTTKNHSLILCYNFFFLLFKKINFCNIVDILTFKKIVKILVAKTLHLLFSPIVFRFNYTESINNLNY